MAIKIPFPVRFFFAVFCFLGLTPLLRAQDGGYFRDDSGDEPRFFQQLVWTNDEYVLHYQVLIQREEGEYRNFMRALTKNAFINVSLPPGKYRYAVLPYNLLGQAGNESEWRYFEVLPAYQPKLIRFSPPAFYLDKNAEKILDIFGANLLDDSEIYLRSSKNTITPIEVNIQEGNRAKLKFDNEYLIPGTYEIYIKNPGGLDTGLDGFKIGYLKPFDLTINLSAAPVIPISGESNDFLKSGLYPGITASFGVLSSTRSSLNSVLEIAASFYIIGDPVSVKEDEREKVSFHPDNLDVNGPWARFADVDVNILLQKWFYNRTMAATLRTGFGLTFLENYGTSANYDSMPLNWQTAHFIIGASYFWLVYEYFFIEAGVSYTHLFRTGLFGFIRPRIGFGWQF
jgi:hypothetical protein